MRWLVFIVLFNMMAMAKAQEIAVQGLFDGAAVLAIDGEVSLMKKGQTKQGVKLISANSRLAVIEVNGQRQKLSISKSIGTQFKRREKATVRLMSQANGYHTTGGRINGKSVSFLVDTGATHISMNEPTAKRLGLAYTQGERAVAQTANGAAPVYLLALDSVSVGAITVRNVQAVVHVGNSPPIILLGNSFLSRVTMSREQGVLVLESHLR